VKKTGNFSRLLLGMKKGSKRKAIMLKDKEEQGEDHSGYGRAGCRV